MARKLLKLLFLILPLLGLGLLAKKIQTNLTLNPQTDNNPCKAQAELGPYEETKKVDFNCFDSATDIMLAGPNGPQNDI